MYVWCMYYGLFTFTDADSNSDPVSNTIPVLDSWASFTHTVNVTVFLYGLKMGSMQSYGAVYTHRQKDQRHHLQKW